MTGPDPWRTARSLEWLTHCPVPFYNFALLPHINSRDEWAWRRQNGLVNLRPDHYEDIHLPNNTFVPMLLGALAFGLGFGMVWRMYWLAGLSLLGIVVAVIARSFEPDSGHTIPGVRIREIEETLPEELDGMEPVADVAGGVVAFQARTAPRAPAQEP